MFDPKSDETIGYHLFFVISGDLGERLRHIISDLSGKMSGPAFDPHITLLARIPDNGEAAVLAAAQKVASAIKPFSVTVGDISMEDAFFRALYLQIKDSAELQKHHKLALEIFGLDETPPYLPHISLFYGNTTTEAKMAAAANENLPIGETFHIKNMSLYETKGRAENWRKIADFAL